MHQAPPARWLRIALMLSLALALASAIASRSSAAPYEERLVDVALRQQPAIDWSTVAAQPVAIKALLLDYDRELAFKAQLGLAAAPYLLTTSGKRPHTARSLGLDAQAITLRL